MAVRPPPARPVPPFADAARRRSLGETLACAPNPAEIRVFAYGSLMWNPCFEATARRAAVLPDYRRALCIWTVHARGTPSRPGLGLALEPNAGASCAGVLYDLSPGIGADELLPLWEREMWTAVYRPQWIRVDVDNARADALAFVVNPSQPQYAGDLPVAEQARYIAAAAGKFGSCRDYLAETVEALRAEGAPDTDLETLLFEVDRAVLLSSPGRDAGG